MFMGWHSQKDKIGYFDFEKTTVSSDISIYAQWVDTTDVTDTDGDGLTDPFEYYYGTDKTKFDTDDDGLNDYFELYIVNTEPLKKDSDNDGITDNLEDADDDKLNNEEEYSLGTNAIYYDTDHDLISDYDEIHIYGTDPLNADTDGDGATDSDEIKIGSNPLTAETTFITESDFGEPTSENPVSIKVDALTDAKGAGTLEVEAVRRTDNYLASDFVAGYLGYAYDLTADGELESAKLTFSYDQSLGTIGDDFQPRIYYLNEETGEFEELPNQTVTDGQVIAETTHFSTYILLNKVEFDKIWETEIKPPEGQDGTRNSIAMVFSIDSSGSMSSNDPSGLRKEVAKDFTQKLRDDDVAAVIDFDSNAQLLTGFTSDKQVISDAIDQVNSSGGTNLGRAVSLALEQFNNYEESPSSSKMIIMLTDGNGSYNSDLTEQAKNNNVVIYTVGLGSSIDEELLKEIADGTGGKYYFASQADELESIFDNIAGETVDKTTDSNNDGISDYYTKLINDGKLCLTNTSYELTGCTDIFGEESADWDGDGLLNGEEIEIIIGSNGQPKIKMTSHPFWADYDCDGYSDYDEVKGMNTDPLKYTLPYRQEYDKLISNTSVRYYSKMIADKYTDNWFVVGVTHTFDWNKTAESEKILVDYFYDYASEDSVNANAKK